MANQDLNIKITVDDGSADAKLDKLIKNTENIGTESGQTSDAVDELNNSLKDSGESAEKSSIGFLGLSRSVISLLGLLVTLAQEYLGLSIRIETTSTKLKILNFFVENVRKEFTISLAFLKRFADFLNAIDFPIKPLTKFIDLMGNFRVVIGIGRGDNTIFDYVKKAALEAADAFKQFKIYELKNDIRDAVVSMGLFAAQAFIAIKTLNIGIARESAFSQASRTINGTTAELQGLKAQIDKLAGTELAVPVDQLYEAAK